MLENMLTISLFVFMLSFIFFLSICFMSFDKFKLLRSVELPIVSDVLYKLYRRLLKKHRAKSPPDMDAKLPQHQIRCAINILHRSREKPIRVVIPPRFSLL